MSNVIRYVFKGSLKFQAMTTQQTIDPIRRGVGMRLAAARESKQFTQDDIAKRFSLNKGTVSAWETGRGDPGIYRMRELAKLYDISADAVLWENCLTNEALQVAAQYDGLTEKQKHTFFALWQVFVREAASDFEVEERMSITRVPPQQLEDRNNQVGIFLPPPYDGPERRKPPKR